ncbi:MAG: L-aspartate oxidase [Candidatus Eisenbacteria bacterium]|nr:L-aspartate oxidase [Candidatus Eisenbacteria bacterium]
MARGAATESDFLVLGSGIAGLVFALRAARAGRVLILTKKESVETNTNLAQGGIAAVMGPDDSFDLHVRDTLLCGEGLSRPEAVRMIVERGPALLRELVDRGIHFSRKGRGFDLGREGGHSRRRIIHAKDATGREVEHGLLAAVRAERNIRILERHHAIDLIRDGRGEIRGAWSLDHRSGRVRTHLARTTLLATGGAGKVYLYTTNPDIASGEGLGMAYRAGARLANLEFVQFHPTCLYHPKEKSFLISEAVRGEGAVLRALSGDSFMERYHSAGSLAPRDVVARAIDNEMKERGDRHVVLDLSAMTPRRIRNRFPNIHARCLSLGIDITREPIPVVPAAHYMCGGVMTDDTGRTNVPRLFAAGEVAHTGVHGANRLASNSLLEALVYATAAADAASAALDGAPFPRRLPAPPNGRRGPEGRLEILHAWDRVRQLMWDYVGIVRSVDRLKNARRSLTPIHREVEEWFDRFSLSGDLLELRSIALVGSLIVRSALRRRESRGLHYLEDHPEQDPRWRRNTIVYRRKLD